MQIFVEMFGALVKYRGRGANSCLCDDSGACLLTGRLHSGFHPQGATSVYPLMPVYGADLCLQGVYLTLVRSSKVTNAYSLPSINFMKHSASEIFCIDHATSYQHAFRYIRQLAIHLRNSMKVKTKVGGLSSAHPHSIHRITQEAYQQVYNWQYVHCVDFWAIVLSRSSNTQADSELQALVYPLVQVSLGAIKYVPASL
jgi:nucleolar complex protein 2